MCLTCKVYANGGDMSPRLWKCDDGHITGMIGAMLIVKEMAEKLKISEAEAGQKALDFLHFKQKEFEAKGRIYFDEDYSSEDLYKKFLADRAQKLGLKKSLWKLPFTKK
jgi:hypothetical protein